MKNVTAVYNVKKNKNGLYDLEAPNLKANNLTMPQVWGILEILNDKIKVVENECKITS